MDAWNLFLVKHPAVTGATRQGVRRAIGRQGDLLAMDPFRLIADRKIQEAMDDGAFENLSGRGQPLPLDDNPFEDPSLRMAHRLLRNNGFAPAWIEEGREIETDIVKLRDDRARMAITAEDFRIHAAALNRRIVTFNLKAPVSSAHKRPIDPDGA
jgi:hypothetical protein